MVVGVCRVMLSIPGNDSLKGKRSVIRRITERAKHRFNVAIAEVDHLDAHRVGTLGFAVVSNDSRYANSMIDTIVAFITATTDAIVTDRTMELLHFGTAWNGDESVSSGGDPSWADDDGFSTANDDAREAK